MIRDLNPDDRIEHARRLWSLADHHCGDCVDYHRLRGAMYLAGVNNGPRHDEAALVAAIEEGLGSGRRILLAGSADAELVGILLRPLEVRPLAVTVIDRCPTPLRLIDQLRLPPDVEVTTRVGDLTQLSETGQFDLILSHSMVSFLPAAQRSALLLGFGRALAPGGRLVITVPTGGLRDEAARVSLAAAWLARAEYLFEASPEVQGLFGETWRTPLENYTRDYAGRQGVFSGPDAVEALLTDNGFTVERSIPGNLGAASRALGRDQRNNIFLARVTQPPVGAS